MISIHTREELEALQRDGSLECARGVHCYIPAEIPGNLKIAGNATFDKQVMIGGNADITGSLICGGFLDCGGSVRAGRLAHFTGGVKAVESIKAGRRRHHDRRIPEGQAVHCGFEPAQWKSH